MPEEYFEQTLSTWHANPWFKCIQECLSIRLLLSHFHPTRLLDSNFEPVCLNRMKVWYRSICFEIEKIAMLDCTVELCECQHYEFSDLIHVETESRLYTSSPLFYWLQSRTNRRNQSDLFTSVDRRAGPSLVVAAWPLSVLDNQATIELHVWWAAYENHTAEYGDRAELGLHW